MSIDLISIAVLGPEAVKLSAILRSAPTGELLTLARLPVEIHGQRHRGPRGPGPGRGAQITSTETQSRQKGHKQ